MTTPFGYQGAYTDPSGFQYLINRYYDPSTGQFLSVDPLVAYTNLPYSYAGDNPINFNDPFGLCGCGTVATILGTLDPWSHCNWFYKHANGKFGRWYQGTLPYQWVQGIYNTWFMPAGITSPMNPTEAPGPGWEWRGDGAPGSNQGNWFNPQTQQRLHPDWNHPGDIPPHYDYSTDGKNWTRIPPGGEIPDPIPPVPPIKEIEFGGE